MQLATAHCMPVKQLPKTLSRQKGGRKKMRELRKLDVHATNTCRNVLRRIGKPPADNNYNIYIPGHRLKYCISFACALTGLPPGQQFLTWLGLSKWACCPPQGNLEGLRIHHYNICRVAKSCKLDVAGWPRTCGSTIFKNVCHFIFKWLYDIVRLTPCARAADRHAGGKKKCLNVKFVFGTIFL